MENLSVVQDQCELYERIADMLEGEDVMEAVPVLAYILALCVAQVTGYAKDKETFLAAAKTFNDAYQAVCVPDNITSH